MTEHKTEAKDAQVHTVVGPHEFVLTPEEAGALAHDLLSAACAATTQRHGGPTLRATLEKASIEMSPWMRQIRDQNEALDQQRHHQYHGLPNWMQVGVTAYWHDTPVIVEAFTPANVNKNVCVSTADGKRIWVRDPELKCSRF